MQSASSLDIGGAAAPRGAAGLGRLLLRAGGNTTQSTPATPAVANSPATQTAATSAGAPTAASFAGFDRVPNPGLMLTPSNMGS